MLLLIKYTLLYGIVLMLVALGGMFSEHSGVINIALEGIMVVGGLAGVLVTASLPTTMAPALIVLAAVVAAAVCGMLYSLLLAFASINLKADQTIGGTALNMLATAIAMILAKNFNGSTSAKISYTNKPFLFSIGGLELSIFIPLGIVLLVVSYIVMYKTRFGLRLRACGENPQAADSLGINVKKMRYAGTTISGALAGMGGFVYAVTTANCSANGDVAGFGFLALAVMIFGNWKPLNVAGGALLFGLFKCIAACYSTLDINGDGIYALTELGLNANFYRLLPYVITLVVLAFTSKSSRAPKAEGIPYDKGQR